MKNVTPLKWLFISLVFLLLSACAKDEEEMEIMEQEPTNSAPIIADQAFEVPENIASHTTIGIVEASDPDGDPVQFSFDSDIDLTISPVTGRMIYRNVSIFDYETAPSFSVEVTVSDAKGASTKATLTFNVIDIEDGPLTNSQKQFLSEYLYLTYKLSPTASGGSLSEKWQGEVKLYMEGTPDNYETVVQEYLEEFQELMTDGTTLEIVDTQEASNIHLIMGPTESVANTWPDMHALISGSNFGGYALYNTNVDYQIHVGRIWMASPGEGLFKHELGHILGLGHTSDLYCENESTSVMCPGAAAKFNTFDREIIKILYHPNTPVGLNYSEMSGLVTALLLNGDVVL